MCSCARLAHIDRHQTWRLTMQMILKHVLDKHEGATEANTLYEEIAERINAGGLKRARDVCEGVINGDLIIFWNIFAIVFFLLII